MNLADSKVHVSLVKKQGGKMRSTCLCVIDAHYSILKQETRMSRVYSSPTARWKGYYYK